MATDGGAFVSDKRGIIVSDSAPLVSIPEEVNGQVVTRYFTEDQESEGSQGRYAFEAIGAAADIDTTDEEMLAQLHRLRHESTPTPLADLDL
jgi:hypothetical protein